MTGSKPYSFSESERAVVKLAEICKYDRDHAHQVAHLATRLFDQLQPVHGMNREARFWLSSAAILHDIAKGFDGHHKAALRIVLTTAHLPFDLETRRMVGLTARYHRKSAPSTRHPHFAVLNEDDRAIVRQLSAILRLADALDSGHRGLIKTVRCKILPNSIIARCTLASHSEPGDRRLIKRKAIEKSALLQEVFGCVVTIKWSAR